MIITAASVRFPFDKKTVKPTKNRTRGIACRPTLNRTCLALIAKEVAPRRNRGKATSLIGERTADLRRVSQFNIGIPPITTKLENINERDMMIRRSECRIVKRGVSP